MSAMRITGLVLLLFFFAAAGPAGAQDEASASPSPFSGPLPPAVAAAVERLAPDGPPEVIEGPDAAEGGSFFLSVTLGQRRCFLEVSPEGEILSFTLEAAEEGATPPPQGGEGLLDPNARRTALEMIRKLAGPEAGAPEPAIGDVFLQLEVRLGERTYQVAIDASGQVVEAVLMDAGDEPLPPEETGAPLPPEETGEPLPLPLETGEATPRFGF